MDQEIKEKITFLNNANRIEPLHKGFSTDKKYVVDHQYLLRLFSSEDEKRRRVEFDTIQKLSVYSAFVPQAITFGTITDKSYMILSYLPGRDAEVGLKDLTGDEQYTAGMAAGRELKKLHRLTAPSNAPDWYTQKKLKSDKYLRSLQKIAVDPYIKQMLETYIDQHKHVMKGRPNTFQHDDFHPANLLIKNRKFSGIIDFQRMDWGDPIHDLTKLGFFSSRISIPFTQGIVDGYHEETGVTNEFWQLYALYSAMHIISSLVWGLNVGPENYRKLFSYSLNVIRDHDYFNRTIPKWYK